MAEYQLKASLDIDIISIFMVIVIHNNQTVMRAIPLIALLLIFSALGYVYRDSIRKAFTGSTPAVQTVVLRQTATPTPSPVTNPPASVATSPVPTSAATSNPAVVVPRTSISTLSATSEPTTASSSLPVTGPVENMLVVAGISLLILLFWRWAVRRPTIVKRPLDIL